MDEGLVQVEDQRVGGGFGVSLERRQEGRLDFGQVGEIVGELGGLGRGYGRGFQNRKRVLACQRGGNTPHQIRISTCFGST